MLPAELLVLLEVQQARLAVDGFAAGRLVELPAAARRVVVLRAGGAVVRRRVLGVLQTRHLRRLATTVSPCAARTSGAASGKPCRG